MQKINFAFFFISSSPKVNFFLARIKGNKSFIICQKKFTFGLEEMKKTAKLNFAST